MRGKYFHNLLSSHHCDDNIPVDSEQFGRDQSLRQYLFEPVHNARVVLRRISIVCAAMAYIVDNPHINWTLRKTDHAIQVAHTNQPIILTLNKKQWARSDMDSPPSRVSLI